MISQHESDHPYSLGDPVEREHRFVLARSSNHVAPVFPLLEKIKKEKNESVPLPDPLDGGILSSLLFFLERPGPKAKESGFVSRNNPDSTAKNIFMFFKEARIPQEKTFIWNIIPWYGPIGRKHISASDIVDGISYAKELVGLMPNLRGIVFVGKQAEKARPAFEGMKHNGRILSTFFMFHPAPRSAFGGKDPKVKEIKKSLMNISRFLNVDP